MFKKAFKFYKNKSSNLSDVVNISPDDKNLQVILPKCEQTDTFLNGNIYGLKPPKDWDIFVLENKPGLILIKNPFTTLGQRYWIVRCLEDFSAKPYKLNIDAHNYLKEDEKWWDACHEGEEKCNLLNKLRWATLGYHHNWDTKVYDEHTKSEFPNDLAEICSYIAQTFSYNLKAESAIVNYYPMNATLSGHTDHSENDLDAPLISISLGQSAIFLIGGPSEDDPATPILLNSGDIVIMSKESRLCYHAVPRVVPTSSQPWTEPYETVPDQKITDKQLMDDTFWKPFNDYVQKCRININVRQVLKPGQSKLQIN